MKKKSLVLLLVMAIFSVMLFSACGSKEPETLESYVSDKPEVQQSIDEATGDSNVQVDIKENEIVYSFDLSKMEGYTEELAKGDSVITALTDALNAAGGTFGNISKSIEEETGLTGISTTVNYTWGDEVLVTKTFTSADAAAEGE